MRSTKAMLPICLAVLVLATMASPQLARGERPGRGQGPPEGRRGEFGPPPMPLMLALDADNDGTISADEIENAATALKKMDRNGDGSLSSDELRPTFRGRGGPGDQRPGRRAGRGRQDMRPGQRGAGGQRGDRMGPLRRGARSDVAESAAAPKDKAEKKILDVLEDLDRNQRRGMMNVPVQDGRLLRLLAEALGAKSVVEIGTSNGYSAIWLCLALRTTGGKLVTYEIDARRAALARQNFKRAGVSETVTLVEGDAHEEVKKLKDPIDLLFIDADKAGYVDYLSKLLPLVRPGGLVIAHNMSPRQADPKYVEAITKNPLLETLILHRDGAGVGVTLKKR